MFEAGGLPRGNGGVIRLYTALPEGEPAAVIHIQHGLVEHAARYQRFAEFLSGRGFAAYAQDHRGHGPLAEVDGSLGLFAETGGGDLVIEDVARVNREIAARHPGVPVVILGHSMGATIALNHALRHGDTIAGLSFWNAGVDYGIAGAVARGVLALTRALKGPAAPDRLMDIPTFKAWNRAFRPNRTTHDWLSTIDAEVDAYVADPLCGGDISIALWQDILAWVRQNRAGLAGLAGELPVHLVGGGQDPATRNGKAVSDLAALMKNAGLSDVTEVIYPGARHETLNEACRDEAMNAFASWVDRVATAG